MTSDTIGPRRPLVSPRVALLSILGFWTLYFAIATLRWLMLDYGHQVEMMAARLLVTIGSMLATFLVYLALRPLGNRPLRTNVTAVALLSIPAAIAYSSMNWAAFHQMDKQIEAEKAKAMDEGKIVVDSRVSEAVRQRTEAAIAAARQAVAQAAEQANAASEARREALAAKAEALREAKESRRAADAARREVRQQDRQARDEARRAADEAKTEAKREADEAKAQAKQAADEARAEARQAAAEARAEARRAAAEARREAAQAAREARQDALESRREAERQSREEYENYQQGIQQAKEAVEMARRHGINIDLDKMLAGLPAPPAPPAPARVAPVAPPVTPTVPDIVDTPRVTPTTPRTSATPAVPAPKATPIPAPVPMVTVRIPTLAPDTATIQVGPGSRDEDHTDFYSDKSPLGVIADQAMNGYFFFAAWGALFLALSYAAAVRIAERESAQYRAAARDAELRALRYQVNPHFLFNTLNSLSTLVLKDKPDEAEKMILNLSTFFRTSLTADPKEDVTLAEEIRLQRLYLDIEAVRFPERLSVDIQVPETLKNACVPCLILQPLVENAIKYGVSRSKRPVNVTIAAREDTDGLVLSVEDDGEPIDDNGASKGTGVGLRNVIDRLRARFGDEASCRHGPLPNGGFGVTIFMPLIRDGR